MALKRSRKVAELGSGSEESEPELVDLEPQALDMASDLGNLDSGVAEGDYGWHPMEYEDSSDRLFRFHRLPSGSLPESDTGLEEGVPVDSDAVNEPVFISHQSSSRVQVSQPQLASSPNRGNKVLAKKPVTARADRKSQGRTKKTKVEPEIVAISVPSDEPQIQAPVSLQTSSDSYSPEHDWEFATRSRHMDITTHILDEIALEGLDGITLQGLFERLKRRKELNNMLIDDPTKEYLWNYAKKLKCVRIYLLSEARADLKVYNRLDFMDPRGNLYEPVDAPDDIYEYFPIDDKKLGIRGSCKEYYKRTPFKSTARKMSYKQIETRYRNKVVLMAPQYIRERAIIPPHIDLANEDLNVIQYCILERTARAREQGEMTRGKASLTVMKIDSKSLHYQRQLLIKKGLLKKQPMNMKYGVTRSTAAITLLHVPRFFVFFETALVKAARGAIKKINESSSRMRETAALKAIYGKHMVRSFLSQEYSMIFEQQDQTYASLDPGAYLVETRQDVRDMMVKRKVKVITLKHPQLDHTNFMQLLPVNEEKEEDEPEQPGIFPEFSYPWNASILVNFIRLVYEARAGGTSINELATAHSISTLDSRTGCRLLQRLKLAVPVLEDKKKTKLNKYVFVKFQKANRVAQNVDRSKAPLGSTSNPLVVQTQPEPVTTIIPTATHETSVNSGPALRADFFEISSTGTVTSSLTPSKSSTTKKLSAANIHAEEHVQETVFNISNTCATIPSGLLSSVPLMLNSTLVNRARTFVLDAKEHDIVEPVRYHELRFTDGEARDFRPFDVEVKDTLTYESAGGWDVCIEPADLLVRILKRSVIFNTERSVNRGNIIMEYIYKHRVILGFQQILREVRTTEARIFWENNDPVVTKEKPEDVDRRSLFRILKQLEIEQLIRMWRVTVQKNKITRIVAFFTPFAVVADCRLMQSATELLIQAVLCRVKLTRDQKKAKRRKEAQLKSNPPKKVKKKSILGKQDVKVTKTSAKAKRGVKQGTVYTPNLDRFVTMATTGSVPIKRKRSIPPQRLNRRALRDEIDHAALAKLSRRRVDWEIQEDCHLLCLFIASVIFIPRYNTSKIFLFNAPQIRDILHSKLPISNTKTTLAIRRRLHFLMRSDSYYCRYRYYLGEALNDETLMRDYVGDHRRKPGHKIFYDIPTEVLTATFDYLFNKFQTLKATDGSDLLYFDHGDSAEQKYIIEQKRPIKPTKGTKRKASGRSVRATLSVPASRSPRKSDVIRIVSENTGRHTSIINAATNPFQEYSVDMWLCRTVLISLIQSGELTHQIQKFVECVPGNVLDMCVHNLKRIGIMFWSKRTQKFGISAALKKRMNSDISPAKYQEGYQCVREIRRNAGRQIMFDSSEFDNFGSFIMLCELGMSSLVELEIELPDPIITVNEEWNDMFAGLRDSSSSDDEEYVSRNSASYRSSTYSNWRVDANAKKESAPRRRSSRSSAINAMPSKPTSLKRPNTRDKFPEQSKSNITAVFGNVVTGQAALHNALHSKSTMANSAKLLRVSNKALRLIRSQVDVNETAAIAERDFFTVNIPKINIWFPGETELDRALYRGRRPTADIPYLENHLIKFVPYNSYATCAKGGQTTLDTTAYGRFTIMHNLIHAAGPVGLSVVYLLTKFTRQSVREGLSHLVHKNLIFLVGITYKKYVSSANVTKWTMPINKEDDSSTPQLRVIMRPWIRSSGTLNFIFLDRCFVSILGYLKTLPFLGIRELGNQMRPILSPVETMLLVEAMAHFKLVKLFNLERSCEVSLFSAPSRLIQNFDFDVLLDMEFLHAQLQPMVAVKYSELQDQMYNTAGGPPCAEEADEVENIVEYRADPHKVGESSMDNATVV